MAWTRRRRRCGFTLTELVVCLAIISVLVALSVPLASSASGSLGLVRCLGNARKIGSAWTQWCMSLPDDVAVLKARQPLDASMWRDRFVDYGVPARTWLCPVAEHQRGRDSKNSKKAVSDFFYTGMSPWATRYAPNLNEYYAFVETVPNHNGVSVYVKGDGSVGQRNFLQP
jgi:prepilin-type N-terminal cleavage/methylation domain-containing protein